MARVLLIGLDGAEPSLLGPWMDEGALPCLAALRARGAFFACASTTPPATFPAWMTCVTGVGPGRHGMFDFTELVRGRYDIRFVNATHRKAPALWNILSDAGKRVCVLGVPGTFPPESVNGCMVSGFDSPVSTQVSSAFVYPPDLFAHVRGWRFADFQESSIGPRWHNEALPRLLQGIETKEAIALGLLRREPWDFFMAVFGESDTVAHHYWLFHDPRSPRHRPGHKDAIRKVYERLDAAVGRLVDAAGPDAAAFIVSDHGFGGAGARVAHINNWLAENGYLRFTGRSGSPLKKLALKTTPSRVRGALFRQFQGLAERAESKDRFAGIDWAHTMAWSEELNYFPSVRINLRDREPEGQVAPEEYERFCLALCAQLESWEPVARALPRGRVYDGPHVDRAPDIVIVPALDNGYSYSFLRSRGGQSMRQLGPDEYLGGKEKGMNGTHRPFGAFLSSMPLSTDAVRLEDIAPTVLGLLGVAGPTMDGTDLLGVRGGVDGEGFHPPAEQDYTAEEERIVEKRLRDLGYLE
ncbi:MAG TPA: alkaline phosphatase family protein [Candidatus Hydrogenedentes bacterium]|nr:alkaline phosphatase family protein [Candidatus Hydrogenedentota bacterium]HOS04154.1 alkaline phosphatase family protein [Candidatus Hydrogenedentota bacterium]